MDELDLSGIDFTDYIKRRCIKKTREYIIFPKLDPFTEENLYKFSNLKFSGQDAADPISMINWMNVMRIFCYKSSNIIPLQSI